MSKMISREAAIAVVSLRPDRYTKVSSVYADRREAALREVLEALAAEVDPMRRMWRGANNANKMCRELEADGAFELLAWFQDRHYRDMAAQKGDGHE
jgi:hypothetical protein